MARPYLQYSAEQLSRSVEKHWDSTPELERIAKELTFRSTKSAKLLAPGVSRRLTHLNDKVEIITQEPTSSNFQNGSNDVVAHNTKKNQQPSNDRVKATNFEAVVSRPWQFVSKSTKLKIDNSIPLFQGEGLSFIAGYNSKPRLRLGNIELQRKSSIFSIGPYKNLCSFDIPQTYQIEDSKNYLELETKNGKHKVEVQGLIAMPSRRQINKLTKADDFEAFIEGLDEIERKQIQLYLFIDKAVNLMEQLRWEAENHVELSSCFVPRLNKIAPLPWSAVRDVLVPKDDDAPMDLIVRIAEQYDKALHSLASSPRKVLKRIRKKEPLARVQEMDAACMSWLTKQPGRSAIEKAGSSQKVMAVAREEDYDTPENRVLKHMLVLCQRESILYLSNFRKKYARSNRIRNVQRFLNLCSSLLATKSFSTVATITRMVKPNYVLQYDAKYHEMWQWYKKLIERQSTTEGAWHWQSRLWADLMHVCLCSALMELGKDAEWSANSYYNHNLWLNREPVNSSWVNPIDWPSPVILTKGDSFVVVETMKPAGISNTKNISTPSAPLVAGILGADFLIKFTNAQTGEESWVFVWSIHSASQTVSIENLSSDALKSIKDIQKCVRKNVTLFGLILVSKLNSFETCSSYLTSDSSTNVVSCTQVPGVMYEWDEELIGFIQKNIYTWSQSTCKEEQNA